MKIALAQIDPTVGDFTGNLERIVAASRRAAALGARLTVFSELAICGYPPADFLEKPSFLARCRSAVDELAAAIPERKADYEKLLPAAADLRAMRCKHLSDDRLEALADEFDRAVGPEWSARYPRTGALLGAAVADELEGNEGAVESLRSWLTDAVRFPAAWIVAVAATLAQARRQA